MLGTGCNLQGDTTLCQCAGSPLYECATGGYLGQQIAGEVSAMWVSTFGYCRHATWIFLVGGISFLLLICGLGFIACGGTRHVVEDEDEDDEDDDDEEDDKKH
eukprot:TRINITY_DN39611_c0_g1_i2.p4 TRINITY_DN39611_c0_g1~~TRINITY_DN39611_c0_g1_i2.p4  ORF type:complete len:103 (-),score=22.49 TRINITY_DN39611_c0_g1_i2:213-521(-)